MFYWKVQLKQKYLELIFKDIFENQEYMNLRFKMFRLKKGTFWNESLKRFMPVTHSERSFLTAFITVFAARRTLLQRAQSRD